MSMPLLLSGVANFEGLARLGATAAVAGLWQGIVLAAAAALALRLVPRTTATIRFLVWTAVLLGAALLPLLRLPGAVHGFDAGAAAPPLLHLGRAWSLAIAALWLLSSLLRLSQLGLQGVRLRSLWRQAQPAPLNNNVAPEIATLLKSVPLRRVELCLSSEVDRPSVIGFFSPRILIPEWLFRQLTAPEFFQIVLHEVEHLRRADDWLNLLQKLSLALFPLNPALVWIERRLCSERELACDDGVLRVTLAPRVYATCLTTLAERRLEHRASFSLSLGLLGAFGRSLRAGLGSGSELSRRVHSILNRQPALSPARTRAVMAMLVVGLAGCAAELARSPQLVSFAAPTPALQAAAVGPEFPGARHGENAGYQAVGFHAERGTHSYNGEAAPQPHMTLLKAAVPAAPAATDWNDGPTASGHPGTRMIEASDKHVVPARTIAKRSAGSRPARSWVVMTSLEMTETMTGTMDGTTTETTTEELIGDGVHPVATRMTVTVSRSPQQGRSAQPGRSPGHQVSPQYAAVPTDLGWLIVEL
jgi:BlaR1 peptidase M56